MKEVRIRAREVLRAASRIARFSRNIPTSNLRTHVRDLFKDLPKEALDVDVCNSFARFSSYSIQCDSFPLVKIVF